jgi:tetratricopeptide (TPR) repeat protein
MFSKLSDKNLIYSAIITVCFIFAVAGIYIAENLSYSKDAILQKAVGYYADERYFMAARYFSKAVDLNASSAELYRNYGISLLRLRNYGLAAKYFKLAVNLDPDDSDNYYYVGNALYREASAFESREKFLQAARYLEKAINLDPYSEKSYLLIGLCFRSCGLQESARTFYKRAILSKNFSSAGFYNLIGNTFREEDRYREALSYYEKAKESDSSFVVAYCDVGDMYLKLNNRAEALLNYRKAIKVDENFIVPHISLAEIYYDRNNFHEASKCCLKALKINPYSDKANYILGMSCKALIRKKECAKSLEKAAVCGNDDAVDELRNMGIDLNNNVL